MHPRSMAAQAAALHKLGDPDSFEVDERCDVAHLDEPGESQYGAWVQVWVFVTSDEIDRGMSHA